MKNYLKSSKLINYKNLFETKPDQPDFSLTNLPSYPEKYFIYEAQIKPSKIYSQRDSPNKSNHQDFHLMNSQKKTVPAFLGKLNKEFHYEIKDNKNIKEHFKLIYVK